MKGLARLDAWFNALYTWRWNPLYHSGALVAACLVVLLATGLYLLLFYRIGSPYESVHAIDAQWWGGRWIRGLHRYASDLAVLAALVHAVRMFGQRKTWGPRAMAWVSGVVLLGILFVCGWTGYVMVWDVHAQLFAAEGARLLDALPIFSEPIGRAFTGERPIPGAFFFMNLFAHIVLPVGIALFLWIHVSRLARTRLLPPKPLLWGTVALFAAAAVLWPAPLAPKADLLRLPGDMPLDVVYGFWLPVTRTMDAGWVWLAAAGMTAAVLLVPVLTRPRGGKAPPPSYVNPRFCTGCEQCSLDCPYEAISMVKRDDGRDGYVGLVDPAKCVSCGVCAGSCAPMGVGPPGRTGRDQLARVNTFLAETGSPRPPVYSRARQAHRHPRRGGSARPVPARAAEDSGPADVVVIACSRGAAGQGAAEVAGARTYPVGCVGNLHTSVIEYLLRAGVGGVMVASCPPRNCWSREGPKWLEERIYNQREAELKDRVDRARLRVVYAAAAEGRRLERHVALFRSEMQALGRAHSENEIEIDAECVVPDVPAADAETSAAGQASRSSGGRPA